MTNLKDMATTFVEGMKPIIGTGLMVGKRAKVGRPTDNQVPVTDGNFPPGKQVYIHFVTEGGDVTSVAEALIGDKKISELTYERPVIVNKNDDGFYYIERVEPAEDAIYSEGIEQLDDQLPVYNRQLIEQCTIHPIVNALQVQVTSGLLGEYYFSGQASGVFSTETVQDTSAANITAPTTNGQAKGILTQIDAATETLEYKQSSEFSGILSLQQAYKAGLLPTVDTGKVLRGYLKWAKGATQFTTADIWNVGAISTGSSILDNLTATAAPTANDDSGDGYSVGSHWYDVTNDKVYICIDATLTAAVWIEVNVPVTDITADTLTLNDGSELTIASGAITVTHARHTVDTESNAAEDALVTVNGLGANEICFITANNTARTVQVIHNIGNIISGIGKTFDLDDNIKGCLLVGSPDGTQVWAYPLFDEVTPDSVTTFENKTFVDGVSIGGNLDEVQLQLIGLSGGTQTANMLEIKATSALLDVYVNADGGMVINEQGRDTDTRIETNNDANAFFVDGGNDNVGFGTGTPDASTKVDVVSTEGGLGVPAMTSAQWASVGASRNGNFAYDTDLHEFVGIKNGASAVIGGSAYVADGIAFTDPTAQTWTALNQGSGTYTEDTTNKRLNIFEDGNGANNIRGWHTPIPSVPYEIRLRVSGWFLHTGSNNGFAIGFRQSSDGKLETALHYSNGTDLSLAVLRWNSVTSVGSTPVAGFASRISASWFKLIDDNTNRIIQFSADGINWHTLLSSTRTTFLTADQIFFGGLFLTATTYDVSLNLLSYEEL